MAPLKYMVENLSVDGIFIVGNRRPVDEGAVSALAESISENGLQMPITVRVDENIPDPDTGEIMGGYALITGAHRLGAYRKLGLTTIPAIVRDCDEIDAEIMEITENLHRSDLTKDQRDTQIRRYAELIGKRDLREANKVPQTATLSLLPKPATGRGNKGVVRKVADQTGLSKDTVRRALFRPDPEVEARRQEDERVRREHDKAIETIAAEAFAGWIVAQSDLGQIPQIIAWLEGAKPRQVIDAIHRLVSDTPVMNRSAA